MRAISLVQLILYRASGRVLWDNLRQVLRIALVATFAIFGRTLGLEGFLVGIAGAELLGDVLMFFAMAKALHAFSWKALASDTLRVSLATLLIVGSGMLVGMTPIPWLEPERVAALIRLVEVTLACLITAWPILVFTKSISRNERSALLDMLMRRSTSVVVAD